MGFFNHDLGSADDRAFDGGVEDDLAGDGIEGHLVVGLVLVEIVVAGSGGGGFVVHDEEVVVEADDAIEMAAEEVGLGRDVIPCVVNLSRSRPPIKLKPKTKFYRRGSVGFDIGLAGIVNEMVKVIDHK